MEEKVLAASRGMMFSHMPTKKLRIEDQGPETFGNSGPSSPWRERSGRRAMI
jgi:hypothetical protein